MYKLVYFPNYLVSVIFFLPTNVFPYMPTYLGNLSTLFLKLPFYLLTYLLTQLLTYIPTYLPMHPPSYLSIMLTYLSTFFT